MAAVSANRLELLQIADAVAREKSIDRVIVIESMQDAIEKAAKSRYGAETNVRAEINPRTGELRLWRLLEVVEAAEEPAHQIELKQAQARNAAAKLGDFITEPLPPIEFGRIAPSRPSRSSCRRYATPSATACTRNTSRASARSSTARSSASNTATSSSIWAAARPSSAATN